MRTEENKKTSGFTSEGNRMKVTKKGDVEIYKIREVLPTREDFFLVEFDCRCLGATAVKPMLFGDHQISIKFWKNGEGHGKPTIVAATGIAWKTFSMDDNILIMVKNVGHPFMPKITIMITKKYHE